MNIMNKQVKKVVKGFTIALVLMIMISFTAEKVFTLKFSEADINKHYQKLSVIRQIVDNSNLSHQEVVYVTKAIDSLQADILTQVKAQLEPAPIKK